MSDQESSREDRQLPATERRLQQAREQGQVARSRDLAHVAGTGALLVMVVGLGAMLGQETIGIMARGLRFGHESVFEPAAMASRFGSAGWHALVWLVPMLLGVGIALAGAGILLGGWNLTAEALLPKPERINPIAGIKRMFEGRHILMQARLALSVAAVIAVGAWYLWRHAGELEQLTRLPLTAGIVSGFEWLAGGITALLAVSVVSACIDVPLQWFKHQADLRMTREEVRQENKESEGDPHVKGERRRRQREMSRGRMLSAVPAASVIVTNPTHYAVALLYDDATMRAPRIVALGADHLALKIREIAAAHGVPTLEAPPLARALYRHGDLDGEVPVELYGAVAQVLAWVMRLRTAVYPLPAPMISVPPGFDPAQASP